MALANGLSAFRINLRILNISTSAITPPSSGETIQLATIWPILPQFTASIPIPAIAKPTIAPTIECVVETGQPR